MCATGALLGSSFLPNNGFTYLPERAPVAVIIVAVIGMGIALMTAYRVDRTVVAMSLRRGALAAARVAWSATALIVGLAAAAPLFIGTRDSGEVLSLGINVTLFAAVAMYPVAFGRPDLVWFPGALLVLAALRFGWDGSDRNSFAWWAVFLSPEPTTGRLVAAVGMWVLAVLLVAGSVPWSTSHQPLLKWLATALQTLRNRVWTRRPSA